MVYSFTVVSTDFEVNQTWLQIGNKKFTDVVERKDYLDYVYEKRIESAVCCEKSNTSTSLAMDTNMKADLCVHTLENALISYPALEGAMIHSDRRTQCIARQF